MRSINKPAAALSVLIVVAMAVFWSACIAPAVPATPPHEIVRTSGVKAEPLFSGDAYTVAVGDEVDLAVACTADEALGIWWSQWPADGLRVRIVVQAIEGQWRPVFVARPTRAGQWSIAAARASADGRLFASAVRIATTEPEPTPNPTPGPTPPGPRGAKQVAIVIESNRLDNLPDAQRAIVASLDARKRIAAAGHLFVGVFDPDQQATSRGKLPQWIGQFAEQAKREPLMVIAPKDGGTPVSRALPVSVDALLESLR